MKIGYICAGRTPFLRAEGGSVHIQEVCRALKNLGHDVFMVTDYQVDSSSVSSFPVRIHMIPSKPPLVVSSLVHGLWQRRSNVLSPSFFNMSSVSGNQTTSWSPNVMWTDVQTLISAMRYNRHFQRQARRVLDEERPDALYERYSQYGLAGVWLAKEFQIPLILEMNGSLTQQHELFHQHSPLFPWLIEKTERYLCRRATAVVVVSAMLRLCLRRTGVREDKLIVLPNAADPTLFRPDGKKAQAIRQQYGLAGKFVVGFVGSMRPWHDLATLVEAVRLAALTRPEIFALIVGDGPLRHTIYQRAQELGLSGRVIFTGEVPHEDIASYIGCMDIATILRPADDYFSGGASMKVFEYMAMAKPVIASGLGLPDDIVQHLQNGILVEPENPKQVAEAILELANDADLRKRLGLAARRAVEAKHTWEHNAQAVVALFERFDTK